MKIFQGLQVMLLAMVLLGLSGFIGGGREPVGFSAGGGYKIQAEQHLKIIREEFMSGEITKSQYDIRKDQIESGSLFK